MELARWIDPVTGKEMRLELVEARQLREGRYQRPLSSSLVGKLHVSVGHGFVIPIAAVETPEGLEVVDGQHRLRALVDSRGDEVMVPVVVVPKEWHTNPLLLNIEKADNVKDKCEKVYRLYVDFLEEGPEREERECFAPAIPPHLLSLASAYKELGLQSPSLVETLIKKLDHYLSLPLEEAVEIRRGRAGKLVEIEREVLALEIRDFNLRKAVVSQASQKLWGRKRMITVPCEEGLEAVLQVIRESDWSHLQKEV